MKISPEMRAAIDKAVAEGRGSADDVVDEMIDTMAMLFRLWAEGDGTVGLPPIALYGPAREES